MRKIEAFTLVELIVVITILAILATIGFMSFQSYTISARDTVRLSDIVNIEKQLWATEAKNGKYPFPEDYVEITSNGVLINYQGYIGKKTLGIIGVNGGGVDPVTGDYYTYVTNKNRVKYQLLSYLEIEENITASVLLSESYALKYADRYPQLSGDKLGIIVDNITKEPLQTTGTGFDISQTTDTLTAYISNNEIIIGRGASLGGIIPNASCKRLKSLDDSLKTGKYMIDPLGNGNEIEILCNM